MKRLNLGRGLGVAIGGILFLTSGTASALTVTDMTPSPNSNSAGPISSVQVTFSQPVDATTINPSTISLINAGADGTLGTADDSEVSLSQISVSGNVVTLTPAQPISATGSYQLRVNGTTGGKALRFDGVGGFVKSNQWLTGTTSAFTVEGWCRAASSQQGEIVLHRANNNDMALSCAAGSASGTATVTIRVNQSTSYTGPEIIIGSWHHIAGVYDGTNLMLYVDGVAKAATTRTGSINWDSGYYGSYIAGQGEAIFGGGWDSMLNGDLDEVRVWNVARTAQQIQDGMHKKLLGNETGLKAYYHFDEGSGTVANDASFNGKNGTVGFNRGVAPVWINSDGPLSTVKASTGELLDGEFGGTLPSGDGNAGGNFAAIFQIGLPSTTLLCATSAPLNYGISSVTLSASVSSTGQTVNTGAITFQLMNGTTNVGSAVTSAGVTNGSGSVTYAIPAGTSAGNYTVAATYNGGNLFAISTDSSRLLAIKTVPLSVTANNFSRVYGAANPTFTGGIVGIQNGDNITATYSTSATPTSSIGAYPIVPTMVDPSNKLGNYSLTLNNGTLTVTSNISPTVTAMTPAPGAIITTAPTSVLVTLSSTIDPTTVNTQTVQLVRAGNDGVFGTADDVVISPTSVSVVNGNQIKIDLSGIILANDKYQVTLIGNISTPPSNGLAAYWSFNEGNGTVAADSSGNGRNGTLVGPTWTTGVKGNALKFSTITDHINIAQSDIPVPWTFGLYVNRQNSTDKSSNILKSPASYIKLEQYPNVKKVGITLSGTGDYSFNYTAPIGTWVHLTFVATAGNTSLYVNGVLQDTLAVSVPLPMQTIGDPVDQAVIGTLDELRVYNRALSAAEVQLLANTASGLADNSGNLMDGEFTGTFPSGDGTPGGNFVAQFQLVPSPFNVTAMTPAPNSIQTSAISSILLTLNNTVNASTVNINSVKLKSAGPDGMLDTADDVTITPTAITVVNNNQIKIDFPAQTKPTEKYRVTLFSNGSAAPPVATYAAGTNPADIAIADMDNDGKLDLVIGDNWGAPNPTILLGDGTGKFGTTISINNWNTAIYCVAVADFNLDGKMDVVQGSNGASSNCPILLNTTTQTGTVTFAPYANFPMGSNDNCIRVADFNGDGKPDLVSSNQAAGTVGVRLNTTTAGSSTLSFGAHTPFTTGSTCRFVAVGDINGDGKPDIVSCNYGSNTISVLINTTPTNGTTPTFAAAVNFTTDTQPNSVELADINGDGKLDIIVPCFNSNKVDVFINTTTMGSTTATFQAKTSFAVTTNPSYISVVDIDGDGKPDIACANEGSNDIALLINTTPMGSSTPTFAPVVKYAVGTRPVAVKIADLTGSGNKAIVSANYNSNTVSVIYPYSNSIQNSTNVNLDGEFSGTFPTGNGLQGGNFTATFEVDLIPTTLATALPASINYGTASATLSATVSSSQTVNTGTITFQLMNGGSTLGSAVTSGSVVNGMASVSYSIPAGTPMGNYAVVANYNSAGAFLGSSDNSQQLTINKAPLTVTGGTLNRAYGSANPTLTGSIVGIKYSDNISATYATSAALSSIVGGYSIVPTLVDPGGKLGNYSVTLNNGTLTVTAAPLSVTPANASRTYGAANPSFTGTITGIKNGDTITATYATSATVLSAAGPYAIMPTLVDPNNRLTNYSVTSNNGTLTVTQATLTAVAFNNTRVYGAANPIFSGILSGVLNGDNILAVYNTSATAATPVGNYAIVPSLVDPDGKAGNYAVMFSNGTLSISQAPLSVTAADAGRVYHAPDPVFTGSITGILNSDAISATYVSNATANSAVGAYTITPKLIDPNNVLGNYRLTSTNGTLTIGKAMPLIVWTTPAPILANVPLDVTQLNASASDAFTQVALTGTFVYTPNAGTLLAPGLTQTLTVTFTPDDAANYTVATGTTTLEVDPVILPAITSASSASSTQGAAFSYTIAASGNAPIAFKADGLPDGLMLTGNVISGIPTGTGVFDILLTATNFAGSTQQPLRLVVVLAAGTNHAPVFASPPLSSADPTTPGTPITLTASATDADGDALEYAWDFGDGTGGLGASVTKTFAAPGAYAVKVVVSDGQATATQSIVIAVNDNPQTGAFSVSKVLVEFNFTKTGSDSLALSGTIPLPSALNPRGKTVRVLVGDLDKIYVLDAKGVSTDKSFALKGKLTGPSAAFTYTLKRQNLFTSLVNLGFSKTISNPALDFPVVIVLDGASNFDHPAINYTVKGSKKGPVSGQGKNEASARRLRRGHVLVI